MQTIEQIKARAKSRQKVVWSEVGQAVCLAANVAYRLLVLYLMARLVVALEVLL